ncbi:MAG: class II aldolase/adducin family protein [Chloroflexi bacterium]|nr:class II aldolase/adducin family protein [Chloroflexota bacterium]
MKIQSREELKYYGKVLVDKKLTWGLSGNISVKINHNTFLISSRGSDLSALEDEDIVLCRLDQSTWVGNKRPSMETELHRSLYNASEDTTAIIHAQPFYCSIIACSSLKVRADLLPEAMAHLGPVKRIPYYHAGSKELADAVASKAPSSQVLLLENHGVVCHGHSLHDALLKIEALEFLCSVLVVAKSRRIKLSYLGNDVAKDFAKHIKTINSR